LVVLHKWIEKNKENATGNELERALKRINREDIINECMHNVEEVTDEHEKQQALVFLEGTTAATMTAGEFINPLRLLVCHVFCMLFWKTLQLGEHVATATQTDLSWCC